MLHSLSAQVSYYSKLINNNPEWKFCGVYADEAITGTSDSRPNFLKMIAECRLGNIDVIITKSISRFARNTVTLLETVRELKSLGIDVYFEEQNIHTMSAEGELVLTILGSYAQEESLSASENQKWKIRKAFQEGKVSSIQILGYKRNKDGILEIVPREAEIVRMIFNNYLAGDGKQKIANMLNEKRIRPKYNGVWTESSVNAILTNEKYSGNLLLQKQFRENHITKKCIKNIGQLPQYYVEEAHEPIIDFETFNTVQRRLALQKRFAPKSDNTSRYPFSGMIHCKCCGKYYRRKTTRTGIVWICHTYNTKGKAYCPTAKQIPENTLFETCCKILSINEFDEYTFKSKIASIIVPEPNKLTFIFFDGHKVDTIWYDRSRSESWTDEMRQNTGERSKQWHARSQGSTILSILQNEKYKGSALLQKSFTTDFLTKKTKKNEGEVPQYYIEESHEAIITPEEFDLVQLEIEKRKKLGKQYSGTHIFSAKLVCGECGSFFGSKVWHSTDKYRRVIWQCNKKFKGTNLCKTPHFYEDEIKDKFIKAFAVFFQGKEVICQTVNDFIRTLSDFSSIDSKISTILQEMQYIADLNELNIKNNSITAQNTAEFEKHCSELNKQYMEKKSEYDKLLAQKNSRLNKIKELKQFVNELSKSDTPLTEFNDDLWRNMIEKVTIYQDKKMMFRFLDGTDIEVK